MRARRDGPAFIYNMGAICGFVLGEILRWRQSEAGLFALALLLAAVLVSLASSIYVAYLIDKETS